MLKVLLLCSFVLLGSHLLVAQTPRRVSQAEFIRSLGESRSFTQLIDLAVRDADAEVRRLAALELTRVKGDGSAQARLNLYRQTADGKVKVLLIDGLARANELESLVQIASWDSDETCKLQALRRVKYLKDNSDSSVVKDWDVSLLKEQLDEVVAEPPPPAPVSDREEEPGQKPIESELKPVTIPGAHLRSMSSTNTRRDYDLYIRVPSNFATDKKYPVLYLLDGQWDFKLLDSVYGGLLYDKYVPEMIIVGITYSGPSPNYDQLRSFDYTPSAEPNRPGTGDGPKFLAFLKNELIPLIEKNYPCDPNKRILMGSSLGGLFTLYSLFTDPSLFSGYVAASPAVLYGSRYAFKQEADFAAKQKTLPVKLFVAVGEVEALTGSVKEFVSTVQSHNYQGLKLESRVIEGERHAGNKPEAFNRGLRFIFRD